MAKKVKQQIRLSDANCRYMALPAYSHRPYAPMIRFLDMMRVDQGVSLASLIEHKRVAPALRIHLPLEPLIAWSNLPVYPREGEFRTEDLWVLKLHDSWSLGGRSFFAAREVQLAHRYMHPLDRPMDPIRVAAQGHVLAPAENTPLLVKHPDGQVIEPWIDYFRYWQIYLIDDLVQASKITTLYLTGSKAPEVSSARLRHEAECVLLRIERASKRFAPVVEPLDWVSYYRTARSLWFQDQDPEKPPFDAAIVELFAGLGVTPEQVRAGLQDGLLSYWHDLIDDPSNRESTPGLRYRDELFREDVLVALNILETVSGSGLSYRDPLWRWPQDRMSRGWTPLSEAVPLETVLARLEFPTLCARYVGDFRELLESIGFDFSAEDVELLLESAWDTSPELRRFCRSFYRTQEHLDGGVNQETLVGSIDETPMDFLVLSALCAEKLLARIQREASPEQKFAPDFNKLLKYHVDRATVVLKLSDREPLKKAVSARLKDKTNLLKLDNDPFLREVHVVELSSKLERQLALAYCNYAILRNYSAHHDRLDWELINTPVGGPGVQGMLLVVLVALKSWSLQRRGTSGG